MPARRADQAASQAGRKVRVGVTVLTTVPELLGAGVLACVLGSDPTADPAESVRPQSQVATVLRPDRIVVRECGEHFEFVEVATFTGREDIVEFAAAALVTAPKTALRCLCTGNPLVVLEAEGAPIGSITVHHARSIGFTHWSCRASLVDSETFLRWFDARGIPGPRADWEDDRRV
jgi:hypothetical protein